MKDTGRKIVARFLAGLAIGLCYVWLIVDARAASAASVSALGLCAKVIVPSLFPFFVCSNLFCALGLERPMERVLSRVVEPLFGGRGFITGHISPRKLAPDMPDAWTDPFTGTEHTGGVFALLPKAERRSEEFMGAALLLWLDKYTEAEFAEKIGSMSYTEGCVTPASDPANEKETTT